MTMIRFIIALIFVAFAVPSHAGEDEDIALVEQYLTSLKSLVASFQQVESDGRTATGKFFLKRPGKMRWQYDPPAPILLVSNGTTITYYDADMDQVNYIPVDESLASFIAEPTIKLDSESTKLTDFEHKEGLIRATIVRREDPDAGSLTLVFHDNPIAIHQMKVRDASGKKNTVTFEHGRIGVVLPDSLFEFEDPRGVSPRRTRR